MAWLWPGCGYGSCVVVNCTVRFGSLSEALLKSGPRQGLTSSWNNHGHSYGLAVAMAMAWLWLWPYIIAMAWL